MQPLEMRTFRFLYHKKEFLTLIKPKSISTSNVTFSTSTKIARFSHHRPCPVRRNVHNGRNSFESKINRNQSLRFFGSDEAGSALNDESPRVSAGDSDEAGYAPNDENPRVSAGDWGKVNRNIEKSVPNPSFQYRPGSNFNGKGQFNKKKGKTKVSWVCSDCGGTFSQWWGDCKYCKASGTIKAFKESDADSKQSWGVQLSEKVVGSWLPHNAGEHTPQRLTDVNKGIDRSTWRITLPGTFGAEVARVLGGGLVPGSLVLVGGDPGVGKSTLLLQLSAMIAEGNGFGGPAPVLYVSGEESIQQIANRADRMRITTEELFLYSSTDIEDILENVRPLVPRALVVDSIQTAYLKAATGSAGSIVQVKECTAALLRLAKKTGIPVFVSGHVTKTGDIGGPRVLEHIVDVVLYMEGEKYSAHRFLRSVKNRFGPTDELGVFEMSECGLQAVSNPSEIFLSEQNSDSDVLTGLAVAVMIDGSRTFLIEIQALCIADSSTSRHINGIDQRRTDMIISVLSKQAGLKLQDNAIFVNVVTGVKLNETAGDLAIAAAICSSFLEFPIPNHFAFIGEIGLGGELRSVPRMEKRVSSLAKLGYKKCVVPKSVEKPLAALKLEGMELVGCKNLKEMINTVFVMP